MPAGSTVTQSRSPPAPEAEQSAPAATPAAPAPVHVRRSATPSNNSRYGLHVRGYILGKTLGSGAYAKVKCAHSVKLNKAVAIKVINLKSAPKDMLEKFLPREIDSLKTVQHPNVIRLHEVIVKDDTAFLVMEMAENGDLLDYINSRRYLSEQMARTFFKDLVSGMSQCHSKHIVHRDLKCENLLLDSQLRLKIADFGFARKYEGKNLQTYCGSYAYAAPEVVIGEPYNGEAADIWSMGVILYAMLAGRLPFKDTDVKSLLSEIATRLYFPARVSEEAKDLIRKMLTYSVKERATLTQIKEHPWMKKTDDCGKTSVEASSIPQKTQVKSCT